MPKIRGIKAEFWTDDAIVELSIPARLLFIGLWNYACDNGHVDDKPRQIKMRIMPADDVDVDAMLEELASHGRITRAGGTITIPKFADHQRPHKRWWTTCDLPSCTVPDDPSQPLLNGGPTVAQPLSNSGPTVTDVTDVDGDGDRKHSRRSPERPLPADWQPTEKHRTYATERRLDLEREVFRFRTHATANDRRQRNWNAAFTTWLDRARDFSPQKRPDRSHLPEAWR